MTSLKIFRPWDEKTQNEIEVKEDHIQTVLNDNNNRISAESFYMYPINNNIIKDIHTKEELVNKCLNKTSCEQYKQNCCNPKFCDKIINVDCIDEGDSCCGDFNRNEIEEINPSEEHSKSPRQISEYNKRSTFDEKTFLTNERLESNHGIISRQNNSEQHKSDSESNKQTRTDHSTDKKRRFHEILNKRKCSSESSKSHYKKQTNYTSSNCKQKSCDRSTSNHRKDHLELRVEQYKKIETDEHQKIRTDKNEQDKIDDITDSSQSSTSLDQSDFKTNYDGTNLDFSHFEKHFYPDFRSLEFLPEDILDPLLLSGMPLGAPLDPYWSNIAIEYYKSHEQSIKAKQRPKKFNCPHCNVAFSNNGQLKGHIRIHTGERPFKCDADNCGKSFTRNEELTRHKRIHSGLRPYPCSHCGKKFGRKDHLKKHLRTHFPQPRFVPYYPYMYGGYAPGVMI